MSDKELIEMLAGVIERNTGAMERVCSAVDKNAEMIAENATKNIELAKGMNKMVAVITGAQRKIGGELGPLIEKSKETLGKLNSEREEIRNARSETARSSGPDARS